jgi:predicted membrane chloride channel (bestrophin family)
MPAKPNLTEIIRKGSPVFISNLKNFARIIDHRTAIVIILAVISTWLCREFDVAADMPTGLIGVAIVFPIVFSINAAYRRREEALKSFASLKANALALIFAHRDWETADHSHGEHFRRSTKLLETLLNSISQYFSGHSHGKSDTFDNIFDIFSQYSRSHEMLRAAGVPANEISRANQYLKAMIQDFEQMRNILLYRTPISLRAYSYLFLNGFPILFGPYFAFLVNKSNTLVGYAVAVLYSLVLVSLDNIQADLENPFDLNGADDIRLNVAEDYRPYFNK